MLYQPLNPQAVKTIFNTALNVHRNRKKLRLLEGEKKKLLDLFDVFRANIHTLDEANHMATMLSFYFPDPEKAEKGLKELLINAVEHGNLKVGYDGKCELMDKGHLEYIKEIKSRLKLKENKTKRVKIAFERKPNGCFIQITDEGEGFEWKKFLDVDIARSAHPNGRGLALANKICFDKLSFNEKGNQVTAFQEKMTMRKKRDYWA